MPSAFNFAESPFDCLDRSEQQLVRDSVDIAYFRSGETVLEPGAQPTHLFVIVKGVVRQHDGIETTHTYGPNDTFDGRGLVAGRVSSRFVAAEEVIAYQLAKDAVTSLIASNATFGALLFSDLSNKLSAVAARESRHELQSLAMARVEEAFLRPAHFVDADTDIVSVVRLFQAERTTTVLVEDRASLPPRLGIFTHTGLQRAILSGRDLSTMPVRDLANFALISVEPSDQLGDALTEMIRRRVHRVVVGSRDAAGNVDRARIAGILEALDVFSFLSNQSYLITLRIIEAHDIPALAEAAKHINRLIALLHEGGTRVHMIASLVQELNAALFERAWRQIAPAELVANSCLFVMGSEGRGEQLLKTDQDNGLVLADDYAPPADLDAICARFSAALAAFGYPDCPGGIMVSNPLWRQSAQSFARTARQWLVLPTPESLMSLAIFLDAHPVAGDARLLERVRESVFAVVNDNQAVLARFASAINYFPGSGGWWTRLFSLSDSDEQMLDLKKAGIFPIVHGVRALALEARLRETSTAARIERLVAMSRLTRQMATDLVESLHFFMGLKLKTGLADLAAAHPVSVGVQLSALSSLDRDLLKDTLAIVRRFKEQLRQRFHLEAVA
jgi:CBS domain-containing protein